MKKKVIFEMEWWLTKDNEIPEEVKGDLFTSGLKKAILGVEENKREGGLSCDIEGISYGGWWSVKIQDN